MAGETGLDRLITVHRIGTTTRVEFRGELDIASVALVEREVARALRTASDWLVLDLHEVSFMDSAMAHLLVRAHEGARRERVVLSVIRPAGGAGRIFDLCGLDDLLNSTDPRTGSGGAPAGHSPSEALDGE